MGMKKKHCPYLVVIVANSYTVVTSVGVPYHTSIAISFLHLVEVLSFPWTKGNTIIRINVDDYVYIYIYIYIYMCVCI